LNVFPVQSPPLRERGEDIVLLAEHFLRRCARKHGIKVNGYSDSARAALATYRWPGNVREMQNTIERAVILTEPNRPVSAAALGLPLPAGGASGESLLNTSAPFDFEQADALAEAAVGETHAIPHGTHGSNGLGGGVRPIAEMEKQAIKAALQQTGGNRTKAADLLGISIRTLRNKLQEYRAEGDLVGAETEEE
ncbi:MAG: helix-turn-helix domain-containing protein, partial [Oleiharenicola lentus]